MNTTTTVRRWVMCPTCRRPLLVAAPVGRSPLRLALRLHLMYGCPKW